MAYKSPISSPMKEYTPKRRTPSVPGLDSAGNTAPIGHKSAPISSPTNGQKNVKGKSGY